MTNILVKTNKNTSNRKKAYQKYVLISFLFILLLGCKQDWLDYSPIDMYSTKIVYDDSKAEKSLSVASVSIQPSKNDKKTTLDNLRKMVEKIKKEHNDIQVIVFGELILGWYDDVDKEKYQQTISEAIPGYSTDFVKKLAKEHDVNIVFGMAEVDATNKLYNTQLLIRPSGEIVKYRKRNLNPIDIENGFTAGNELVSTDISGVKVALFICSDMQSNQVAKEVTGINADVILESVASTTDLNENISYVGLEMNTWLVFANRFGKESNINYTGFSHIINPAGTIVERAFGNNVYVYRKLGIIKK